MKVIVIIRRIIQQIFNDKRSLGLILLVPIFLFTLFYFLLGDSDYQASIAANGIAAPLIEGIERQDVTVVTLDIEEGKEEVKDKSVDAFLYKEGDETVLLFESTDAVKTAVVQKAIQNALKELSPQLVLKTEFLYGKSGDNLFNSLGYILLGVMSFFIVFIIAGISFVRERTNQTMERLMITPVKRWQVVL
jgi:ABC-2 type transport system permease protein